MSVPAVASILEETHPEHTWKDLLHDERGADYFKNVIKFVEDERRKGRTIYPSNGDVFNSLAFTPFSNVRVVIIGQDPYHGPGQAHGLCFSVKPGVSPPPSLVNIFKELNSDLGIPLPNHGCLESWARQGVLLLNAVLTVEAGKPQSHAGIGWEIFTDRLIALLNEHKQGLVFLLWGTPAQKKAAMVDPTRHHILKAPHPSPLSASRGFFGCKHFSKTNELLVAQGHAPINWQI